MLRQSLSVFLLIALMQVSAKAITSDQLIESTTDLIYKEEGCAEVVDNHMLLIEESEAYFAKTFNRTETDFSSYEIQNLQKVLKLRYDHLAKVLAKFHSPSDCNLPQLGDVVAVYDFNVLSESTIQFKEPRRMIYSFATIEDYGMQDFTELYDYFTRLSTIEKVRQGLTQSDLGLLEMFALKVDQQQSGVKIVTLRDRLRRSWNWVIGKGLIRSWGVMSDYLRLRHGHLRNSREMRESLLRSLKPLDVILEQNRATLTSKTIPGHWGHVAVWLGTKEELQKMGIWDRPDFAVFRKNIEQGRSIVQMYKQGVVFESLDEFMDSDEIAVMRVAAVQGQYAHIYPRLVDQLNKKYDFVFDAKSLGKITCTEFISFSYGDIQWPTRTTMGRIAIAPDDVAKLSQDPKKAELVIYVGSDSGKPSYKSSTDWFNNLQQ